MSQLTSPPTDFTIPGNDPGSNPATTPGADVSGPGQLYFSVPIAGPTGSAAATTPGAMVSGLGQLYFSVPIAGPTGSAPSPLPSAGPAHRSSVQPVPILQATRSVQVSVLSCIGIRGTGQMLPAAALMW